MIKPLITMDEVNSLFSVPLDRSILFRDEGDIEKFIELYEKEGKQSREDIVDCLSNFCHSLHSIDEAIMCFSSCSTNHGEPGDGENFRFKFENGEIIGEATVDIKMGDELLLDYRQFEPIPQFYVDFCKKEGQKDVVSIVKEAIGEK